MPPRPQKFYQLVCSYHLLTLYLLVSPVNLYPTHIIQALHLHVGAAYM